jgi:hypothetical protein
LSDPSRVDPLTGAATTPPATRTGRAESGASGSRQRAQEVAGQVADQARERGQEVAGQVADQARERGQEVAQQARGSLRQQVDQRSTQAGEQVGAQADDIRSVAQQLRSQEKERPAKLAEQTADRLDRVGGYLREADGDRILDDVEAFARRNPSAIMFGGLALGLMASRFLQASSRNRYGARGYQGAAQWRTPGAGTIDTTRGGAGTPLTGAYEPGPGLGVPADVAQEPVSGAPTTAPDVPPDVDPVDRPSRPPAGPGTGSR